MRSRSARARIKSLIGTIVKRVESVSRVVGEAGQTMQQIFNNAERMKVLIGEISAGIGEQTAGLATPAARWSISTR